MANATGANIKGDAPLLHPLSKWRWNQVLFLLQMILRTVGGKSNEANNSNKNI